ncbi:MAG: trp operon repressor [Spirochaetaceae bacterium]|jgi:TrpR family trp operon transcriptional repressor|nr:trp operon repressor [Spirochaetaceae bacterium]
MTDSEKKAIDQAGLREMCGALSRADNPDLIYDFLECLLTPAERTHIAERWLLVREIARGQTQREISRMFGMSLCKITRGSREFKKEGSAFKTMFSLVG